MAHADLRLYCPGFVDSSFVERGLPVDQLYKDVDLGGFFKYLSRAQRSYHPRFYPCFEQRVLADLGYLTCSDKDIEVGALIASMSGYPDGWWMKADPVYLSVGLNDVTVMDSTLLDLHADEIEQLVSLVNTHFIDESWELIQVSEETCVIGDRHDHNVVTTPLSLSISAGPDEYLPSGKDGAYWRRMLTEMQMVLHGCAVNKDREERGLMPVNSFWLWGAGLTPVRPETSVAAVWGGGVSIEAAARYAGCTFSGLPDDPEMILDAMKIDDVVIIVLSDLLDMATKRDFVDWQDTLARVANGWLVPIIRTASISTHVTIDLGTRYRFVYDTISRLRFWRKERDFSYLLRSPST